MTFITEATLSTFTPAKDRQYHGVDGAAYYLPADKEEADRLNAQYLLLKDVFGGNVVYAPVALSGDDWVLDNGTGTGAWIMDVRSAIPPSISMFGVDLQTRLVPLNPPANTHFLQGSLLDLPRDWTDRFALVNQRLLVAALSQDDWKKAVSEIYRVLKPGGWAQILEVSGRLFVPEGETDGHADAFNNIAGQIRAGRGIVGDCFEDIPDLLRGQGFLNVAVVEERRVPMGNRHGQVGERMLRNIVSLYQGMKSPALDCGIVSSEEDFDKVVDAFEARCNESGGIETRWYAFCAQKP